MKNQDIHILTIPYLLKVIKFKYILLELSSFCMKLYILYTHMHHIKRSNFEYH